MKTLSVDIIITEKPAISRVVAKALAPELFDEWGQCAGEHRDIIIIRDADEQQKIDSGERINCVVFPFKERLFRERRRPFHCQADCVKCPFLVAHTDSHGMKKAVGVSKRLRYMNKSREKARWKPIVFEDLKYFVLPLSGMDKTVIIVDTQGTPYTYRFIRNYKFDTLEDLILKSTGWDEIEKNVYLEHQFNRFEGRSHEARKWLFTTLLAKRKLPDGTRISIDRVIAATDYDVAGSYIAYSLIEAAHSYIQRFFNGEKGLGESLDIRRLRRMRLATTTPSSIQQEFMNPEPFDWGNAYAGKLRQLFDYLYGITITQQLNRAKNKAVKAIARSRPDITQDGLLKEMRLSVGRTKSLALAKLIEMEKALVDEPEGHFIYLIFEGLLDKTSVEWAIQSNAFIALELKEKRTLITETSFLKAIQEARIGTHTTRSRLGAQLVHLGLAESIAGRMFSTPFGMYYHDKLRDYLESESFSISRWNDLIQLSMARLGMEKPNNSDAYRDRMEKQFRDFMHYLVQELQSYLWELHPVYENLAFDFVEKPTLMRYRTLQEEEKQPETVTLSDTILLEGPSALIEVQDLWRFIDKNLQQPLPASKRNSQIMRLLPVQPQPIDEFIRKVCCLTSEREFQVLGTYNLDFLIQSSARHFTVFRAESDNPKSDFQRLLEHPLRIEDYEEESVDLPETNPGSHGPIEAFDVKLGDIYGQDGLLLLDEYNLPWEHTSDKIEKKLNGKINLASFIASQLLYERIEWYRTGKVHNYESILITMFEKYGISFADTAKMMEHVYLDRD